MRLKDLFKRKKEVTETSELATADTDVLDIPKVVFEDLELQVTIGQWLGLLSSQQGVGNSGFTVYTHLSAYELMKRTNISTKDLANITKKFGELFKISGVDSSETCVLSQYNKDNFSFNCHFQNANEDADMNLRWGDMFDFAPEFNIDYKDSKKTYYYNSEYEQSPMSLKLQHYTLTNTEKGNTLWRYLSPFSTPVTLSNGEYKLSIDTDKPESIKAEDNWDSVNRLRNEEELEQYLLGLSFPLAIDEVYKKMCEISLDPVSEYPRLSLKVEKMINDKESVTTDLISISNGQINDFIITRNGRTVHIDNLGGWKYSAESVSASRTADGKVSYSISSVPMTNGAIVTPIEDSISAFEREVEAARQLKITMFKK